MKHRLFLTLGLAVLACAAVAATASAGGKGRLFQFRGELLNASSTSVQLQVEGGNRAALRALLGQSQDQTFAIGSTTEILDLAPRRPARRHRRRPQGQRLGRSQRPRQGRLVALGDRGQRRRHRRRPRRTRPASRSRCTCTSARWPARSPAATSPCTCTAATARALRSMLDQSLDQTFTYDDGHHLPALAGEGADGDRPVAAEGRRPDHGSRPRAAPVDPRSRSRRPRPAHVGDHEPASDPDTTAVARNLTARTTGAAAATAQVAAAPFRLRRSTAARRRVSHRARSRRRSQPPHG